MVFNDTSTKAGLIQACEQKLFGDNGYGVISGDSTKLLIFTNLLNRALDEVTIQILGADGQWEFDDSNYTDLPIGTTNIVSGQRDYTLSVSHLKILKVLIKGNDDIWNVVPTIDIAEENARFYSENNTGNSGTPNKVDKLANTIFLDPVPDYSKTAGLKIYYQREPSYFSTTDTTKTPGFASIFHELVVDHAVYKYGGPKQLPAAATALADIVKKEAQLIEFYSKRDKDHRARITTRLTSSI